MKRSGIINLLLISVAFVFTLGCNKHKQPKFYTRILILPTVIDTNYAVNGLNNPNLTEKVKGLYSINNIIIDTSDICYFYQHQITSRGCCTDGDTEGTEFINLNPYQLVAFPNNDIEDILEHNLIKNQRGYSIITVSSPIDSINQTSFKIIADFVRRKSKDSVLCGIRLMTEEEKNVLHCKKKNIQYDKAAFKWKTQFRKECR